VVLGRDAAARPGRYGPRCGSGPAGWAYAYYNRRAGTGSARSARPGRVKTVPPAEPSCRSPAPGTRTDCRLQGHARRPQRSRAALASAILAYLGPLSRPSASRRGWTCRSEIAASSGSTAAARHRTSASGVSRLSVSRSRPGRGRAVIAGATLTRNRLRRTNVDPQSTPSTRLDPPARPPPSVFVVLASIGTAARRISRERALLDRVQRRRSLSRLRRRRRALTCRHLPANAADGRGVELPTVVCGGRRHLGRAALRGGRGLGPAGRLLDRLGPALAAGSFSAGRPGGSLGGPAPASGVCFGVSCDARGVPPFSVPYPKRRPASPPLCYGRSPHPLAFRILSP